MSLTQLQPIDQAVVRALEAQGFSYHAQTDDYYPLEERSEKFHGWEIHSQPIFLIGHTASGHYWLAPVEVGTPMAVKRVKKVILRAIAQHLNPEERERSN